MKWFQLAYIPTIEDSLIVAQRILAMGIEVKINPMPMNRPSGLWISAFCEDSQYPAVLEETTY